MALDAKKLVGLKRVSYSAARAVLNALPDEIREACQVDKLDRALKKARAEVLDAEVKIRMDLPLDDGTTYTWTLASPQAVFRKLVAHSPFLQTVLRSLEVDNSYSNPLSIVHYHDEVTSGNLLAPVKSRSFYAFRFTFKELGKHLLTCQQMWFEYAILRSSVLEKVVGGISYVFRRLMHLFFTSHESFRLVGVQLDDLGNGPTVLFGKNTNLIADMEAAHGTFDLKGSSAIMCCMKCANCVKKGALTDTAHPLPNPDGRLADITSPTLAAFVPNTNKAVFDNVDELQRLSLLVKSKELTKAHFKLATQACGMNHNPHGLLLDMQLRTHCPPLDLHTEDWAHVYLCNGVGGDELWHLLDRLKACDIKYDTFRKEFQLWAWPKHHTGGKGV